ncbi:hypothetical protein Dda3937_03482 [Dickeya dadantii 3937]|uniref:Uncharacterized protein n=1 Tax=Dickeya dadantii (strain 3937) TaxID=198628 RepID=E0SMU2_DICD3|nr:hypothetical protein Dda3937_03482 [Dickeya dadantii 3937]
MNSLLSNFVWFFLSSGRYLRGKRFLANRVTMPAIRGDLKQSLPVITISSIYCNRDRYQTWPKIADGIGLSDCLTYTCHLCRMVAYQQTGAAG